MIETAIRVLVVDDHDLLRKGLAVFLNNTHDLEMVGEAVTGHEAIRLCELLRPDVVLMDLFLPDMSGIATIQRIHAAFPDIQVLVLTTFCEESLVRASLHAGAIGYLVKNISSADLAKSIRLGAAGHSALSPEAANILINTVHSPIISIYQLSQREQEVLTLMARGYSNQQIAECLTLSLSTIKKHVGNILRKLQCTTRVEAIIFALQHNLVDSKS
jgi:NarL family two-component system response regulator LiaR